MVRKSVCFSLRGASRPPAQPGPGRPGILDSPASSDRTARLWRGGRRGAPVGESRDGGTCDDCLCEMIRAGRVRVAGVASDAQGHCGHDDAVSAQLAHRLLQPAPRILPHVRPSGWCRPAPPRSPCPRGRSWSSPRSSCSPAAEMPSAIPAGTQPAMSSLAKSGPDSPEVNGRASGGQPLAPHGRADHLELDGGGREAIAGDLGDLQ